MEGILKLNLSEEYRCKVKGLGEVFEIVSIEILRKSLLKKNGSGMLYLSSNYDHSKRGYTRADLEKEIRTDDLKLVCSGYADAPPWNSDPNEENEKGFAYNKFVIFLSEFLFNIWIPFFERFYRTPEKAHVTWAFGMA